MLIVNSLGALSVSFNGQQILTSDRKARALLLYLMVHSRQTFSRTHLQALLWSNSDAKRGRASLRKTLSNIQKAVPILLRIDQQQVALANSADYQFDIDQLQDNPFRYSGQFLQGFDLANADVWHDWLIGYREWLTTFVIATLETHGHQARKTEQFAQAVRCFKHALALDEWREQTHRALMLAYSEVGDRMAALAQFEHCRQLLQRDLGATVSAETARLAKQIQTDTHRPQGNLPARDSTPLVGRVTELAEIGRMLQDDQCHLISIIGLGGIGKTRLAIAAAREQATQFAHGVWFVDLVNVGSGQLIPKLANVLNLSLRGRENLQQRFLDQLKTQHALLILDNFESLLDDANKHLSCQLLQTILQHAPHIKLLITTRERLNLRGEWVYTLHGLQQDAKALFIAHTRRLAPRLKLTTMAHDHIAMVCQLLEGLPLAIELAASWTRVLSLEMIVQALQSGIALLATTDVDVPLRQRSLSLILEQSFTRLTVDEQRVLQQFSLFQGSFSRAAAESIANATLFHLTTLIDKSLLYRVAHNRYRLHESLRQFLRGQMVEYHPAQQRFARFYIDQWADALPNLFNSQQQKTVERLNQDRENFLMAWSWCLENRREAWLLSAEKTLFYLHRIPERWQELHDILKDSLEYAISSELALILNLRLAAVYAERADLENAARLLSEMDMLAEMRISAEAATQGFISHLHGIIAHVNGDYTHAKSFFQQAIANFQAANNPYEAIYSTSYLAYLGYQAHNFSEAQRLYEQVLATYRNVNDQSSVALTLHNLAYVEEQLGNQDHAHNLMMQSLAIFTETDSLRRLYTSVESLNVFVYQSTLPLPSNFAELLHDWLASAQATGDRLEETYALGRIGCLEIRNGDVHTAYQYLLQSTTVGRTINLKWFDNLANQWLPMLEAMLGK